MSTPPIVASLLACPVQTTRLQLRQLQLSDQEAVYRLVNNPEVSKQTARIPYPYTIAMAGEWIAAVPERVSEGEYVWVIIEKNSQQLVGCISFIWEFAQKEAVVGYWLGQPFWGKGYMSEALAAIVEHAFIFLPIQQLQAHVRQENFSSKQVLKKNGFQPIGSKVEYFPVRQENVELDTYSLSRDNWFKRQISPVPILLVGAAILLNEGHQILLAQRPAGKAMAGLWEFPGGKINPGETPEQAVIRELFEELDITVKEACLAPFTFASHRYRAFHLLMPVFVCRRWQGEVRGKEGQQLQWVATNQLSRYPMPPADIPLIAPIRDFLGK
ncbi:MAG TPA: 8-oxo-dGTP diphosphatase MutT [Alphaproteobacteria bacterium]|nr:8-oxo-dGTP diphosphatase MutT [Alphaproteobacteria bacterium]